MHPIAGVEPEAEERRQAVPVVAGDRRRGEDVHELSLVVLPERLLQHQEDEQRRQEPREGQAVGAREMGPAHPIGVVRDLEPAPDKTDEPTHHHIPRQLPGAARPTEERIQAALETLLQGRTAVVIAHRLSTIKKAHKIVVLHKGQIKETGTHDELLAARGLYWKLYRLQSEEAA